MIINTYPGQRMTGGDVRGMGDYGFIFMCSEGDALLTMVDGLRDQLIDKNLREDLQDEAVGYVNNKPLSKVFGCDAYVAKLRDLASRMRAALSLPPGTGPGVPWGVGPSEPMSLPLKLGLGLGALVVGGGIIAWAVRR